MARCVFVLIRSFLNQALKRNHYPLSTLQDLLRRLSKAKVVTVIHGKSDFWQVKLDAESRDITTMATPMGRYKWARMPFGISPVPKISQQKLDDTLCGLDGVMSIADDTLIVGEGTSL